MKIIKINDRIRYIPEEKTIIQSSVGIEDGYWNDFIKNSMIDLNEGKSSTDNRYYKFEDAFPTTAGILLTNKCPLKCSYCFYNSGEGDSTTLDKSKIAAFVKKLIKNAIMTKMVSAAHVPSVKIILSGGGEPTADFDLFRYCINTIRSLCAEANIESFIHLVTNGITTTEVAKFIVNNVDSCNISFDGIPSLQNSQRPMGNGKKSIEYVLKTASVFDSMGYKYGIRTTVTSNNYNKMTKMADYVYSTFNNLCQWQIEAVYSGGRARTMDFSKLDEFGNCFRDLTEYSIRKYGKYPINSSLTYKLMKNYCNTSVGTNYWLDAYGDIIPCAEHFDKTKYRIAFIDDNEIIVDKNDHDKLFEDYEAKKDRCCSNCVAVYHCAGGCPMRMIRNNDGELIDNYAKYSCLSTKNYWNDAIIALSNCRQFGEMIPEIVDQVLYRDSTMKVIRIKTFGE